MLSGRQFSDWQPGERVTTAARTVTEADVMAFIRLAGLLEPLFLDREFIASETIHKVPIAPGSLTFAFAEGLAIQAGLLHRTGMAFLGIEQMQLTAPVKIGDTIRVEIEVLAKEPRGSRPGGVVRFRHVVRNQLHEPVMTYEVLRLIRDLPAA